MANSCYLAVTNDTFLLYFAVNCSLMRHFVLGYLDLPLNTAGGHRQQKEKKP